MSDQSTKKASESDGWSLLGAVVISCEEQEVEPGEPRRVMVTFSLTNGERLRHPILFDTEESAGASLRV